MKICLAQIEVRSDDIIGNTAKAEEIIRRYDDAVDLIVFPELAIPGYNCGSMFENQCFVEDAQHALKHLATLVSKSVVIIGNVRWAYPARERNGDVRLHNSAYVLKDGEVWDCYDKTLLANAFQHEDKKYFQPGDRLLTMTIADSVVGVLICEDIWRDDHDVDLPSKLKHTNPGLDIIVALNMSYFTYDKLDKRRRLLEAVARDTQCHVVYVNAVGVGDITKNVILYDGRSMVYGPDGALRALLPAFVPALEVVDTDSDQVRGRPELLGAGKYEQLWEAILYCQREFYSQIGIRKAQVHVSGGIDSSIVAVAAVKAMGPEGVVLITNPSISTGEETLENVDWLGKKLGVPIFKMDITKLVRETLSVLDDVAGAKDGPSTVPFVVGTVEALTRTLVGLSIANWIGSGVSATGNHTENILGWFTFHDIGSVGVVQLLGDLTKTEINELAEYVNRHYGEEIIPSKLYDGRMKPMAELADAKDDPFDYRLYSGICASIIRERKTPRELMHQFDHPGDSGSFAEQCIAWGYDRETFRLAVEDAWNRSKKSVYKSAQSAPILILSPRSRGFSARETILNHYSQTDNS